MITKKPETLSEAISMLVELEAESREDKDYIGELEAENERLTTEVQHWENDDAAPPLVQEVLDMPSLDRDRFLADLCRECALLGIEWPASPRDETARIAKR